MSDSDPGGRYRIASAGMQARQLLSVGQVDRAIELAAEQVSRNPNDPAAQCILADVLLAARKPEPALVAAGEAIRLDPNEDRGHFARARALLDLGRFAAAEQSLLRCMELDPGYGPYHLMMAEMLGWFGKGKEGLEHVEEALRLDAEDPTAHQVRARLLLQVSPKKWPLSDDAARRSLRLDPGDPDPRVVLGAIALQRGRLPEAEEHFRAALHIRPDHPLAIRGLSEVVMGRRWYYRPFLTYSGWMERAGPPAAMGVIFGSWVLYSGVSSVLAENPAYADLNLGLQAVWLALCAYTWFALPITKWILKREYPWLKGI